MENTFFFFFYKRYLRQIIYIYVYVYDLTQVSFVKKEKKCIFHKLYCFHWANVKNSRFLWEPSPAGTCEQFKLAENRSINKLIFLIK